MSTQNRCAHAGAGLPTAIFWEVTIISASKDGQHYQTLAPAYSSKAQAQASADALMAGDESVTEWRIRRVEVPA